VRLEGRAFGDVPLNLEYKLEVWDSPNSAGVIIDAVRCAKIALDRGIGDVDLGPVVQSLIASGYTGRFTVEYEGRFDGTLRLYRSVKRARALLGD